MADETLTDSSSTRSPTRSLVNALWRLRSVDPTALAAETAYYAILAVAPFIIFVIAGVSLVSLIVPIALLADLELTVVRMAPGETARLLLPLFQDVEGRGDEGMTTFGLITALLVALWSSSRAIGALLKGIARISGRGSERVPFRERIVALVLALVMGTVLILSISVFLFGGAIIREIAGRVGISETFQLVWSVLSWPLMAGIVLLVLSVFYWVAGGRNAERLKFFSSGAIVATVLWLVVMLGMRVYLAIIEPGSIYGVLGSVAVLVVFFFIMSLALLFGASVNAEMQQDPQPDQPRP